MATPNAESALPTLSANSSSSPSSSTQTSHPPPPSPTPTPRSMTYRIACILDHISTDLALASDPADFLQIYQALGTLHASIQTVTSAVKAMEDHLLSVTSPPPTTTNIEIDIDLQPTQEILDLLHDELTQEELEAVREPGKGGLRKEWQKLRIWKRWVNAMMDCYALCREMVDMEQVMRSLGFVDEWMEEWEQWLGKGIVAWAEIQARGGKWQGGDGGGEEVEERKEEESDGRERGV